MIRLATEQDFVNVPMTECSLRICALKNAYGLNVPFIRYYADGEGTLAAVMDGFCMVYSSCSINEEWLVFLRMLPDVLTIHTNRCVGESCVKAYNLPYKSGLVMRLDKPTTNIIEGISSPPLGKVYDLLSSVFHTYPSFDGWYVDVSHRIRHGCCHIACVVQNDTVVSCAMSVAETADVALIGGVATQIAYRHRGMAKQCITRLIASLPQSTLFIAPNSDEMAGYYNKIGFTPCDEWVEISLI